MGTRDDREAALACVDVYHRALAWVVGLAAAEAKGRREVEGFLMTGGDIEALGIPLREILERVADGMRADPGTRFTARELAFWKSAIRRFAARDAGGRIRQGYPGERPGPGTIDHVELTPRPMYLPFCDIAGGLERAAPALGLEPRVLHFRWRRLPILGGEALFQAVTLGKANPCRALAAIERWREDVEARIGGGAEADVPPEIRNAPPVPDGIKGAILPRRRLAALLNTCRRTLQRWDSQGFAAGGLPWFKGWRESGGTVLYDVEKLWPTLSVLIGRNRERRNLRARARAHDFSTRAWREEQAADPSGGY